MNEFITGKMDAIFAHQLEQMERDLKSMRIHHRPSITISREFGCEGYPLAKRLAEKLSVGEYKWSIYGRDAIKEIAESDRFTTDLWETIPDETRNSFTQYLEASLAHKPTDLMLFKKMAKSLKLITLRGFAIVLGAAGAAVTQGQKYTWHFRLVADEDFRLNRIMEMGHNAHDAKQLMRERDEQRARFVKEFTGKDIRDPHLYTLTLNNAQLSVEEMSETIIKLIQPKFKL